MAESKLIELRVLKEKRDMRGRKGVNWPCDLSFRSYQVVLL